MKVGIAIILALLAAAGLANPILFQWDATTNGPTGYVLLEGFTTNSFAAIVNGGTSNAVAVPELSFPRGTTYWAVAQNGDAGTPGEYIGISGVVAMNCAQWVVVNGETNAVIYSSTDLHTWTLLGAGPVVFPTASSPCRFFAGNHLTITGSNSVTVISNP